MADLAASIIGIVSAGTKVALVLSQLASGMGSAGKEARSIASEIRGLCAVLQTLYKTLARVETSPYFVHCLELTDDMTAASLEMYSDILTITKSLQAMAKTQEGGFKLRSRAYWVAFQKPKIIGLRAALEAYKSNLALMLGTLNISEKATRPIHAVVTLRDIMEDKEDNALLNGLQLDHESALIDLQETEKSLKDLKSNITPSSPDKDSETLNLQDSSTETATLSTNITAEDQFLIELREEIESLRSSKTSFYSFHSMSDSASRHSKRLSQLLAKDQDRISRRWSQTLSETRSSSIAASRGSLASVLSAVPKLPDLTIQDFKKGPCKTHEETIASIKEFYKNRNAKSYCFSCFDLLEFSHTQNCQEVLEILFQRYDLGDAGAWREYKVKLLIVKGCSVIHIHWDEYPVPLIKQFTQQGKSCGILLEKPSDPLLLSPPSSGGDSPGKQIIDLSGSPKTNEATSPSASTNPQVEVFKTFRASIDDPCSKVLPVALAKYGILADWRQYALYIVYGDQERCLGLNERPLILYKQLGKEGKKPMFMLRKHAAPVEGWVKNVQLRLPDSKVSAFTPVTPGGWL